MPKTKGFRLKFNTRKKIKELGILFPDLLSNYNLYTK